MGALWPAMLRGVVDAILFIPWWLRVVLAALIPVVLALYALSVVRWHRSRR